MSVSPLLKVRDVAYPRLQVPDLDRMESYLMDFGLVRAERRDKVLFMRGAGAAPHAEAVALLGAEEREERVRRRGAAAGRERRKDGVGDHFELGEAIGGDLVLVGLERGHGGDGRVVRANACII